MTLPPRPNSLGNGLAPPSAGLGFKAEHFEAIRTERPTLGFFEIHAENYMGAGGPPHRRLEAIRRDYPLSLHGVGLSIGSPLPLDRGHLARLASVARRYEPALFSEHLAWSSHQAGFFNDLLPLPLTEETLERVAEHIDEVQTTIGRRLLLENPSTYLAFASSTIPETEFLAELVRRTGCGLLLDVNNIVVSGTNHGYDPFDYLAAFPLAAVEEIHLAGYAEDSDESGRPLLIDAHNSPVRDGVWALYREAIGRLGPVPTLIEWDNDVPDWAILYAEAREAEAAMAPTATGTREFADAL